MNKQILSLMCVALLLALALVLANEKWPDGYRTAPQVNVDTTPVGAVVKGAVTLPETENAAANTAPADEKRAAIQQGSADSQNQGQKAAPQGELVAIDNGTLHGDVPTISVASESVSKTAVTSTDTAASDKATPKAEPAPQKTSDKAAQGSATEQAAPAPKPEVKKESTAKTNTATSTAVLGKATPKILLYTQEAVLEIKATAPIRCKTFKLTGPHRLVVDLIGKWDVPSTSVPSNTIIQRIRVGEASERTRIVLDLKRALKVDKIVQVNDTTINIRMQ
ncbi:MAG: AMIN domain-containing protein [Pseudomonadota bacterium]